MTPAAAARIGTPSAALIIPALDEAEVIGQTLSRIPPGLFRIVIVADNGSSDGTATIAAHHGAHVVVEPERGYGAACLRAIAALPADIDFVVFLQADGSEDPAETPKLLSHLIDGCADLALGSRTLGTHEPGSLLPHQAFGNWLATTLIRWIFGYRYSDLGPFRAIRADVLRSLGMRERNYGWTVEMQVRALQAGLRVVEVPVSYSVRKGGTNKVSGSLGASFRAGAKILSVVFRSALRPHPRIRSVSSG